jgi:hypothetical protein
MPRTLCITVLVVLLIPWALRAQVDVKAARAEPSSDARKAQEDAAKHKPVVSASGVNKETSLLPETKVDGASHHSPASGKTGLEKHLSTLSDTKGTAHHETPGAPKDAEGNGQVEKDLEPHDLGCGDPKLSEIQKKKCRDRKPDPNPLYKK